VQGVRHQIEPDIAAQVERYGPALSVPQ